MNQQTQIQPSQHLETGSAISKILASAGLAFDQPAFSITWEQVAEEIARALAEVGVPLENLDDEVIIDLAQGAQKALQNDDVLFWRSSVRAFTLDHPIVVPYVTPFVAEDDEGHLTEQYENAIRLGDEDGYWVDGGVSADFFEDF